MSWLRVAVLALSGALLVMQGVSAHALQVYELTFELPVTEIDGACCGRAVSETEIELVRAAPWSASHWLRIEGLRAPGVVTLSSIVDRARLYWRFSPDEPWRVSITGDRVAAAERSLDLAPMVLPLEGHGSPAQAYLHIEQTSVLGLAIAQEDAAVVIARERTDRQILVFLLGFIVAITVYNLLVSALLRDALFLLNALTILSLLVVAIHLTGYDSWFVWREHPLIGETAMNLGLAGANGFGLVFIRAFLMRMERAPDGLGALLWPVPFFFLSALAAPWAQQGWLRLALLVMTPVSMLMIGATLLQRERRRKSHALILSIPFLLGVLPAVILATLHRIGGFESGVLLRHELALFLALESMLFSLVITVLLRSAESARVRAERDLRVAHEQVSGRILQAQDRERRRVAQDLHDGVGQRLLFLINTLRLAGRSPSVRGTPTEAVLEDASGQASQVLDGLRRISRNMHPASLDHLGWVGAVRALVDGANIGGPTRFTARFELDESRLSGEQRLHLYRIVQEAISNVLRHADARYCEASFVMDDDRLVLEVEDDGRGVSASGHFDEAGGIGLTSIRERVRLLEGTLVIGGGAKGGTRLRVVVPLAVRPASAGQGGR
ncbi:MAG: 7TM diverse intracellular signaling domain-containing protein [Burkholderiaceae bacterium]